MSRTTMTFQDHLCGKSKFLLPQFSFVSRSKAPVLSIHIHNLTSLHNRMRREIHINTLRPMFHVSKVVDLNGFVRSEVDVGQVGVQVA